MKKELSAGTNDEQRDSADYIPSASLAQNGMLADAVQEGNRLISEFDGWKFERWCFEGTEDQVPYYKKYDKDGNCIHNGIAHHPEYNDWNSLMPVVQKIKNLYRGFNYPAFEKILSARIWETKENIRYYVIEFLKQHKTNNNKSA